MDKRNRYYMGIKALSDFDGMELGHGALIKLFKAKCASTDKTAKEYVKLMYEHNVIQDTDTPELYLVKIPKN